MSKVPFRRMNRSDVQLAITSPSLCTSFLPLLFTLHARTSRDDGLELSIAIGKVRQGQGLGLGEGEEGGREGGEEEGGLSRRESWRKIYMISLAVEAYIGTAEFQGDAGRERETEECYDLSPLTLRLPPQPPQP